ERLVVAVIKARDYDRSALPEAELVPVDLVFRQAPEAVRPRVGIQGAVAEIFVSAAGRPVRARAGHELDLDGALAGRIRRARGFRHGDLLDEIVLRPDIR